MQCKVLLCDDSEIFRKAIKRFLQRQHLVNLVGESSDFEDSVRMVRELQPDVVILDLHMVPDYGLNQPTLRNVLDAKRLLVVSAACDQESRDRADLMGAHAFLDKMDIDGKLIPTIVRLTSAGSERPMRLQPIN